MTLKRLLSVCAALLLLPSCAARLPDPLTPETKVTGDQAIIVYGFACRSFRETVCTIEFTRLNGDAFSLRSEDRLRSLTGDKNIYSFENPEARRTFAYYAHSAQPGTYALRRFTTVVNGQMIAFNVTDAETDRPYGPVQVEAGKIYYLGDFTFYTTPFKEEVPVEREENPAAVEAFLKTFPNFTGERVTKVIEFGR